MRAGNLNLHREPGDRRAPVAAVPLRGAEVVPGGLGPKRPFSFRILQGGAELAALEVIPSHRRHDPFSRVMKNIILFFLCVGAGGGL